MAKRGKSNKIRLPGFVAVPWDVLNSAAFRDMSPTSRAALPYFFGKPKTPFNRPEYFDTDFTFSYPEACRHGFAKATFARILRQLVEHGFVDPVDKGGLKGFGKSCSKFNLSRRWLKYGTQDFIRITWDAFEPK